MKYNNIRQLAMDYDKPVAPVITAFTLAANDNYTHLMESVMDAFSARLAEVNSPHDLMLYPENTVIDEPECHTANFSYDPGSDESLRLLDAKLRLAGWDLASTFIRRGYTCMYVMSRFHNGNNGMITTTDYAARTSLQMAVQYDAITQNTYVSVRYLARRY